jgi:hypothetical protein
LRREFEVLPGGERAPLAEDVIGGHAALHRQVAHHLGLHVGGVGGAAGEDQVSDRASSILPHRGLDPAALAQGRRAVGVGGTAERDAHVERRRRPGLLQDFLNLLVARRVGPQQVARVGAAR